MGNYELDLGRYAALARQAAAEGCVLLENRKQALPLKDGEKIAVFGRSVFRYYKSGLGSGGLVNTRYVVGILDAMKECGRIVLDEKLLNIYEKWIEENPYDEGEGWGKVPWSQKEMPVTDEMLMSAKEADASVIVIGRTAGEDQDNTVSAGSYLLSAEEKEMIQKVCSVSKRSIVVLNTGNIIDMKWVNQYHPQAVLYAWQGGQEGGNSVLDILMGDVNPCGKMTDTIAVSIDDYPAAKNFGDLKRNVYQEDIYVGYRYFETFAQDRVLYPFGYGLSYTEFAINARVQMQENCVHIIADVTNTGKKAGKEVVQVYVEVPQGKLGNPTRKLVGFTKTRLLKSGESERLFIDVDKYDMASYDDSGITGHKSCYVLEEGIYNIYVGTDVRSAELSGGYKEGFRVLKELQEACAPTVTFQRIKATVAEDGNYHIEMQQTPVRTVDAAARIVAALPDEIPYTGNRGHQLVDVLDEKITLDEFVGQLDDDKLIQIFRGEGMCSPRVTPGTASAFGGVSDALQFYGIPAACCADGPSGIRMDCGTKAFSMPNGTALGCTFNLALLEELYKMEGQELRLNKIDSLLGPGMNIHRHPLNGRNFEYISEDPYLTGKISAVQLRGMDEFGIGATIKHFCANNQESARRFTDAVISERALREIYLKGFEIAVKEGKARSVMTTYGAVNGLWTAGNYDLCTTILRGEWGFNGIVMTDWWAEANYEGHESCCQAKAPMVAAQNDIYMVVSDSVSNPENDDVEIKLKEGYITRGQLQRNAKNILRFIMRSPSILHKAGRIAEEELKVMNQKGDNDFSTENLIYYEADTDNKIVIDGTLLSAESDQADVFGILLQKTGVYSIGLQMKSDLGKLAQLSVSIFFDNILKTVVSVRGTEGETIHEKRTLSYVFGRSHFIKLFCGTEGLQIEKITIQLEAEQ